jgi:Flp pilus assembly protein TadG
MNIRARLRREDGAAAVEFALIAGVLAMLIFGMLQFGVAFFQIQNLRAATREGARAGAVGATVGEIQAKTQANALGALPTPNGIEVRYTSNGTSWGAPITSTTSRACPPKAQQVTNSAVQVTINLNNVSQALKDIFVVDIPLLPPIHLENATISGAFRCEGN